VLARGQFGLAHQLEHAKHGIHRRADFVAHVGQEGRLGGARGIRLVLRPQQAAFERKLVGNVPVDACHPQRMPGCITLNLRPRMQVTDVLVAIEYAEGFIKRATTLDRSEKAGGDRIDIVRVDTRLPVLVVETGLPQRQWLTIELEHAIVPLQLVALDVPCPDTELCDLGGHQQLVARSQHLAALFLLQGNVGDDRNEHALACTMHGADGDLYGKDRAVLALRRRFTAAAPRTAVLIAP